MPSAVKKYFEYAVHKYIYIFQDSDKMWSVKFSPEGVLLMFLSGFTFCNVLEGQKKRKKKKKVLSLLTPLYVMLF